MHLAAEHRAGRGCRLLEYSCYQPLTWTLPRGRKLLTKPGAPADFTVMPFLWNTAFYSVKWKEKKKNHTQKNPTKKTPNQQTYLFQRKRRNSIETCGVTGIFSAMLGAPCQPMAPKGGGCGSLAQELLLPPAMPSLSAGTCISQGFKCPLCSCQGCCCLSSFSIATLEFIYLLHSWGFWKDRLNIPKNKCSVAPFPERLLARGSLVLLKCQADI